ncbi:MAG: PQQ-binding-like beta-propeller repeat protein [Dokdonella sp.]
MNQSCRRGANVTMQRQPSRYALGSLLATGLLLIGSSHDAAAESLSKVSTIIPGYLTSNVTTDMPTADFDGDGHDDIVVLGSYNNSDTIQIVGVEPGQGWKIKQAIVPEPGNYSGYSPNLATWNDVDGAHLLYTRDNTVSEYAGWPLVLVRTLQLSDIYNLTDAVVADTDQNGVFELIVASNDWGHALRAYSLTTGTQLWQVSDLTAYNSELMIAQLDADPALEIVFGGNPGTIIDGATHAIEWQYKDGLGPLLASGRFGGSTPRFASLSDRIIMFQSQPWSPLWDFTGINAQSAAVADVDGDLVDELIFYSWNYPYAVRVVDVQSQTVRSTFEESSAQQIAAGDFDGDSAIEIAIGRSTDYYDTQRKNFRVINASSGVEEFAIPAQAPGAYVVGGFIADGGNVDLVYGSSSGTRFAGSIARIDSSNGTVRWKTPAPDPNLDLNVILSLEIAPLAGQAEPVVLAAGTYNYNSGQIVALRSSDGGVQWRINSNNSALPANVVIYSVAAVDLDSDTMNDAILACTSESRLRLFSAADRSQIWSSVYMSGQCRGALQLVSNGSKQIVAVLSNAVRAYDAQTHLLSWSLPSPNDLLGAIYIAQGVAGPELALFDSSGISFYDLDTRSLLRDVRLPDLYPIEAVAQPPGASINDLVVASNGKFNTVDGISGAVSASSDNLGSNLGQGNALATYSEVGGTVLIGAGSDVAVSTYRLSGLGDKIFNDGFESATR